MTTELINNTFLGRLVKIDQHITAEDDIIISLGKSIVVIHKVDSFKLNLLTELWLYTYQLWVGFASHEIGSF